MSELSNLIAELEKAEAGSRGLDAAIAKHLFPKLERRHASYYVGDIRASIEPYTTSIDAALTLVPKRMDWMRPFQDGKRVSMLVGPKAGAAYLGTAKSDALALCIAALKARQAND